MIRNILLLAAVSLTAMTVSAQDAAPTDTIPAITAADGTPVEMLDEANIYDDERDEQIDSLRQAVAMLQSQLASQQETIDRVEEDELNRKIGTTGQSISTSITSTKAFRRKTSTELGKTTSAWQWQWVKHSTCTRNRYWE